MKSIKSILQSKLSKDLKIVKALRKLRPWLLSLAAALLVTLLIGGGALLRVDKWVQDSLYQRRSVPSGDIVIFGIDEDALDILGPYHTWGRDVIAQALEALAADPDHLPAAVAVDVLYSGATTPEADQRLADAADALGCVVTASLAEFGEKITWEGNRAVAADFTAVLDYEAPYPALRSVSRQGHINAMTDLDGILRHALLYVDVSQEQRVYSMAAETARLFLESRQQTLELPPVNAMGHFYVPYTALPGDFYDGISIVYLMSGRIPAGYWANKIVLIGPYAPALQDAYFTPMDKAKQMYGVEFQANVIQSLVEKNFKTELSDQTQLILLFVLCLGAMLLFLRLRVLPGGAVCLGLMGLGFGGPILLYSLGFVTHPLWIPAAMLALYLLSGADHYAAALRERQALALEKERIGAELAMATRIQANSLPKEFPPFPDRTEFDIFASMTPAKEVGGDLYDFFLIDGDHLGLVIGDVSGKGVPAALFMMLSSSLIHHAAMRELSPAKVLETVNAQICERNPEEMFVTVWLGVLEISTGRLTAANAGHEFPALKNPDGSFELFKDRHGFVIGGMAGMRYRQYEIHLEPGSKLFVYTDGVAEATNSSEELFGTDRMIAALRQGENGTPEEILAAVDASVQEFVGAAPQFDDLTMLCLQYNGHAAADHASMEGV